MNIESFRKHAHELVDWMADYYQNIEQYPVRSQVKPGEIKAKLPVEAPLLPESFDQIMKDVNDIILPGITHWQHPNFHAFFPANTSFPSILGEMIMATFGAQCMIWETSPAAAELEEQVMEWLKSSMDLPKNWHGVIQDTASTATLAALLTAREVKTSYAVNEQGFEHARFRIYCSAETHSSVEKAVKIAGFGRKNLVKVDVKTDLGMSPESLLSAIESDLAAGYIPLAIVSSLGTTGAMAFDPIADIGPIAKKYGIWHHVDAAYAGSAFILPEYRYLAKGLDSADSYVFNPHKWLLTNFDCTCYFVRDKGALIQTFEILPEYLKTKTRGLVNDYRDWGIPLGRRFRALKLWIVLRSYGLENIRAKLRQHMEYSEWLETEIRKSNSFEMMKARSMNMVVFRFYNKQMSEDELSLFNSKLVQFINDQGGAYLTPYKIQGKTVIRIVTGQSYMEWKHVHIVWNLINDSIKYIIL